MRITANSSQTFRHRIVQLLALSCVLGLAACNEITAPESEATLPDPAAFAQSAASDALRDLSASLDDMTGWSIATLEDNSRRGNLVGVLNGLKGHLKSGNAALCQQDVTQARAILDGLTEVQQVELGHVGLALDVVQQAIDGDSQ